MSNLEKRTLAAVISLFIALTAFLVPSAQAAGTGTISGTVTVVDGGPAQKLETQAQVQVLEGGTWKVVENYYTRSTYTSAPLAPGTYRVEFTNMDFLTQVSPPVYVGADSVVTVDAVMNPGASIRGQIIVPVGGPSANAWIRVYGRTSNATWVQVDHTLVEPDGSYHVGGLPAGDFKVGFGDFNGYYATEYFNDVATIEQAQILTVPTNGNTTGIDVTLAAVIAPVATAVTMSPAPRLVGTARVGQRLRTVIGATTPSSATVRYRWLLDGRRIKKATKRSIRLTVPMRGHRIAVRVIATAPGLDRYDGNSASKLIRLPR